MSSGSDRFQERFEDNVTRSGVHMKLQDRGKCQTELLTPIERLLTALSSFKEVFDLRALFAYIAKTFGYSYGLQFFSVLQTKKLRSSALLTGNVRCLQHSRSAISILGQNSIQR